MNEQKLTKKKGRPQLSRYLHCCNCKEGKKYKILGQTHIFCKLQKNWHGVFDACTLEERKNKGGD